MKIIFSRHQVALETLICDHSTQKRKLHQTVVTDCFRKKSPLTVCFHSTIMNHNMIVNLWLLTVVDEKKNRKIFGFKNLTSLEGPYNMVHIDIVELERVRSRNSWRFQRRFFIIFHGRWNWPKNSLPLWWWTSTWSFGSEILIR